MRFAFEEMYGIIIYAVGYVCNW